MLFNDSRLEKHGVEFQEVAGKYGKELENMANYYSIVEGIVAEEVAKGKAEGIVMTALEFGKDKGFIIRSLVKKLNISVAKAEEYYETFPNKSS